MLHGARAGLGVVEAQGELLHGHKQLRVREADLVDTLQILARKTEHHKAPEVVEQANEVGLLGLGLARDYGACKVARTDRAVANKVAACLQRTRVEDLERPPETREAECIDPSERERLEEAVSTVRARHHGDGLAAEFKALGEDETAPSQ